MKNNSNTPNSKNALSLEDKIKGLDELEPVLAELKSAGKIIVHCHGVFDLLHPGHIRHIAEARGQGDILVVTITADEHVNKGPGRPVFNEALRAETMASLENVSFVVINHNPTAVEAIKSLRPDVYVKGGDYADSDDDITGKIVDEAETVDGVGGRIHFTDDIRFSSSSLINQNFISFPPETNQWLQQFRQQRSEKEVLDALQGVSDLNVLVLGEGIVDEYVFCSGLGKASKDPILAFLHQSAEACVGGAYAVANHLGNFCNSVEVATLIGETNSHEEFISRSLHPKVRWHSTLQPGAPTLTKCRFVDDHTGAKIFELYSMDDDPLDEEIEAAVIKTVNGLIDQADMVVVSDFGHGLMTPALVDLVSKKSKFLVVNTQANAGNQGFNTISKYPRADYVCIAGNEMELETRTRHASRKEMLLHLTKRIDCPRFTVTLGRAGSIHYELGEEVIEAPALAARVVDRVGAGDAVLAITGALVAVGTPWDIVALVANAAGAEMVADIGNRASLSKASLSKYLVSLLK